MFWSYRVFALAVSVALGASAQTVKRHHSPSVNVSFPNDAADPLTTLRSGHPRLFATAEDFDRIAADRGDPLRAEVVRRVIATADAILNAPVAKYELPTKDGAVVHDKLLFPARRVLANITTCSMAYRFTSDLRYARRAKAELLAVVAFKDWTPDVFLATSEMSLAVAIGYDWCYETLTPVERLTIRKGLMANALRFIPDAYGGPVHHGDGDIADPRLWWVISPHNWNQVCTAGLLAGALAVAEDEPAVARLAIRGTRTYLPISMHSYSPDGAWPEGPGYWSYGTTFNVFSLAMLKSALGTDYGLDTFEPDFPKTALFRLNLQGAKNHIFNFADAGTPLTTPVTSAFGWLAREYHVGVAAAMARDDLRDHFAITAPNDETDRFFPFSALWLPAEPTGRPTAPLDSHFRGDAEVTVFHSAWNDPDALYLCFKTGANGGSHAHLDLGSFFLDADGVRWAGSLGPESYEVPEFFGKKRYTYYRMNNFSQNTLTPGNSLQGTTAVAPITAFQSGQRESWAVADLSAVYPHAIRKWHRGVFLLGRSRVLIQDQIDGLTAGTSLFWRMMTSAQMTLSADGRTATLTQSGKTLRAELLSPQGARFSWHSAKPATARESQNEGFAVLEASVPAGAVSADFQLAVLLTPVGPHWPKDLPRPELKSLPNP
jgi:hypothetical protein